MNVKEILRKVCEKGYSVVAIRHMSNDENYNIGDMCRNSYEWNYELDHSTYEDEEQIELDGTCGYHIVGFADLDGDELEEAEHIFQNALHGSSIYSGKPVVIAGNDYTYGNDENEIIISDACVIAK